MDVKIKVTGQKQVERNLSRAGDRAREAMIQALRIVTLKLSGYVKERKLTGQALNVVTGRLRNSITPEVRDSLGVLTGRVGTNVFYGRIHEEGLGAQTEKRFLRKSLQENKEDIFRTINRFIGKAVRGTR